MSALNILRRGTADRGRARRLRALVATVSFAVAVLSACGNDDQDSSAARIEPDRDGFNGTLVDPPLEVAPVTLSDTAGNPVRLDQVAPGKATAFFFGFTNCDDICPTTMADLATARRTLPGDLADRVSLVFITVDPGRDTPNVLRTWLDQFDPDIVGLRGPTSRVNRAERSLYSTQSEKVQPDPKGSSSHHADGHADTDPQHEHDGPGGYEVNHSSVVYLFGPDGRTVLYTGNATPNAYGADLARLLGRS